MADRPPFKNRGVGVPVPSWWLDEVNLLVRSSQAEGLTLTAITTALNEISQRRPPWTPSSLSRFLSGDNTTLEMIDAFVRFYEGDLPPPVLFARSPAEAAKLTRIARTFDATSSPARRPANLAEGSSPVVPSDAPDEGDAEGAIAEPGEATAHEAPHAKPRPPTRSRPSR